MPSEQNPCQAVCLAPSKLRLREGRTTFSSPALEHGAIVAVSFSGRELQSMGVAGVPEVLRAFESTSSSSSYRFLHRCEYDYLAHNREIVVVADDNDNDDAYLQEYLARTQPISDRVSRAYAELRRKGHIVRCDMADASTLWIAPAAEKTKTAVVPHQLDTPCVCVLATETAFGSSSSSSSLPQDRKRLVAVVDGDVVVFLNETGGV
eukprot:PhM_4_TR13789/c0_g2_i1/m.101688